MTEISMHVPDQPDDGGVVLDRDGCAWQREDAPWVLVNTIVRPMLFGPPTVQGERMPWAYLLADYGPVRVVWTGSSVATAAALGAGTGEGRINPNPLWDRDGRCWIEFVDGWHRVEHSFWSDRSDLEDAHGPLSATAPEPTS